MGIAIVTGASSGMGREFAKQISERKIVDEIWVLARRAERLEELKQTLKTPVVAIECDMTAADDMERVRQKLESEKPDVRMLVNCAGFAKFGTTCEIPLEASLNMIDLDVRALVEMTQVTLPHMREGMGAMVVNVASVAAFQPLPDMNIYAASKAFVLSYSRALNYELQDEGISVTAVCPSWTKTEFFDVAQKNADAKAVSNFPFMLTPAQVVGSALKAALKHKEMCVPGMVGKGQLFFTKIIPNSLIMRIWDMLKN